MSDSIEFIWDCDCERFMSGPKKGQPIPGSSRIGPGKNCFDKHKRLHSKFLSGGLKGKENFGDIDGAIEKNHRMLLVELKGPGVPLKTAQKLMYKYMSQTGLITAMVMTWEDASDPKTLSKIQVWFMGRSYDLQKPGLDNALHWIRVWRAWTMSKPTPEIPTHDKNDILVINKLSEEAKLKCDNEIIDLSKLLSSPT